MINVNGLDGCRDISIYLGNHCNFNCTYCDRDYIKDTIGGQFWSHHDIPLLLEFLRTIGATESPPEMFSFHGGEPFSYVKIMDKTIEAITAEIPGDYLIFIQTNGSLLQQHEWFFEKWGSRLAISISYDFLYQDINRSAFQIAPALEMMKTHGVENIQFQYVMPIQDPKVFGLNAIKSITDLCFKNGVRQINLIPLRHIRGKDKFRVIVDELDLPQFFDAFLKFIHVLYTLGMDVIVDGHSVDLDKHYFDNHKQMVLSPDGYIYPEYDFLEYKRHETIIGQWKAAVELNRQTATEDEMLQPKCITCPARDACGLKFLYGMFDIDPSDSKCAQFYQMLSVVIKHAQKLKQRPSFFHWVGI